MKKVSSFMFLAGAIVMGLMLSLYVSITHAQSFVQEPIVTPPPPLGQSPVLLSPLSSINTPSSVLNIKIKAYLHEGVSENDYRDFIGRVSVYYQQQGASVQFMVNEVIQLSSGESCGWSRDTNDVINCVGPDIGGYYGPPWYRIDLNTSYPWGFNTNWGLHCAAHEFGHFLGIQDLYWLQTTSDSPYQAPQIPWPTEIMLDPYLTTPIFSEESLRVIRVNLERIAQGGVDNMLSVRDRMTTQLTITVPLAHEQCYVFLRERSHDFFKSKINSYSSLAEMTDDHKRFGMMAIGGDNPDNNFDLYYVECNSGKYWLHSRLVEDNYFWYGNDCLPLIECKINNGWCKLDINDAPVTPLNPEPVNGATNVPITQTLHWQGGDPDGDSVTYTVAFGAATPPPVVATTVLTSFIPISLATDTAYYWIITATDGLSTSVSATWNFTTTGITNRIYLPVVFRTRLYPFSGQPCSNRVN